MSMVGYFIVQQERAEQAVERYRLERRIAELKAETVKRRAILRARQAGGGRLVEIRPRGGGWRVAPDGRKYRPISHEEAYRRIATKDPEVAARLRQSHAARSPVWR